MEESKWTQEVNMYEFQIRRLYIPKSSLGPESAETVTIDSIAGEMWRKLCTANLGNLKGLSPFRCNGTEESFDEFNKRKIVIMQDDVRVFWC